jgi:predicted regulator of Ras-like GTPase activity (Roadblock/LC7/MglB family)
VDDILEQLLKVPSVEGVLVVGKDGLVITSAGTFQPDPDSFGAGVAEFLNNAETVLQARGASQRVSLEQDGGLLQLTAINEVTFLVLQAAATANLGRVRLECDRAAAALGEQL